MKIFLSNIALICFLFLVSGYGCNGGKIGDEDADGDDVSTDDVTGDDVTVDDDAQDPVTDDPAAEDRIEDPASDDGEVPTSEFWAKTYGGWEDDMGYSIIQTSDGGYIVAGDTFSYGEGESDFWVIKLDGSGNIEWEKAYGGSGIEEARSILASPGGGYLVTGLTESFGMAADGGIWALKLDAGGNVEWQKAFEGGSGVYAAPAHGSGYVLTGGTTTFGLGSSDIWVINIDEDGNIQWQNTYGGADMDWPYCIQMTSDGGYVVAGWTSSFGAGWADYFVIKLDGSGNVQWSKTYGGVDGDQARFIQETSDNGFIVAGWTMSFGAGDADMWLIKLGPDGLIGWQNTYGGSGPDRGFGIAQSSDNGFIVAGRTESFGAGNADMWILKLTSDGNPQWQMTVGSSYDEDARSSLETADGAFVITGKDSYYGTAAHDFWVLKMDTDGSIGSCPAGMIGDSSASPSATSVMSTDAAVTPASTDAVASDTNAEPLTTETDSEIQCPRG